MAKKRIRTKKTSKGERSTVASNTLGLVRKQRSAATKLLNMIDAWAAGKNPWITVTGPTPDKKFVRVRANDVYGDPRYAKYSIFKNRGDE